MKTDKMTVEEMKRKKDLTSRAIDRVHEGIINMEEELRNDRQVLELLRGQHKDLEDRIKEATDGEA